MSVSREFAVSQESIDGRTHVLAIQGELDALTAPKLGRRLMRLASSNGRCVIVDLSATTFMDSTGLGVILDGLRHLSGTDGHLAVVCPTKRLLRPFQVAGLTSRLSIFPTRDDALGSLAAASG